MSKSDRVWYNCCKKCVTCQTLTHQCQLILFYISILDHYLEVCVVHMFKNKSRGTGLRDIQNICTLHTLLHVEI